MFIPGNFVSALLMTISSALLWGSWANTYKGTRHYPFALFYWDYIFGVVLAALGLAFSLGSHGSSGEPFLANLKSADFSNLGFALAGGAIFNVANVLLVAAIDIAGLAIAFPIAIGIAVIEGVVLSYLIQPKGGLPFLALGVCLALVAVLFNARAYSALRAKGAGSQQEVSKGVVISVVSGVLMGAFAPLVTRAMTSGHTLTPYSVAVVFSVGALLCCMAFNTWLMARPISGPRVSFSGYLSAGWRNHILGLIGGLVWGLGGCFNFIAAGYVGVPISYAIGQSAPLIAAAWGVLIWREFAGAPKKSWRALACMAVCYAAAITSIALAYRG